LDAKVVRGAGVVVVAGLTGRRLVDALPGDGVAGVLGALVLVVAGSPLAHADAVRVASVFARAGVAVVAGLTLCRVVAAEPAGRVAGILRAGVLVVAVDRRVHALAATCPESH